MARARFPQHAPNTRRDIGWSLNIEFAPIPARSSRLGRQAEPQPLQVLDDRAANKRGAVLTLRLAANINEPG